MASKKTKRKTHRKKKAQTGRWFCGATEFIIGSSSPKKYYLLRQVVFSTLFANELILIYGRIYTNWIYNVVQNMHGNYQGNTCLVQFYLTITKMHSVLLVYLD